jgi:peptide-methionine (S)-S-oxide reductase
MNVRSLASLSSFVVALACAAGCRGATSSPDVAPPSTPGSPTPASTMPAAAATPLHPGNDPGHAGNGTPLTPTGKNQLAAFAAGCFWGVEDAFRHVHGVVATAVGYSGGHTSNPTYEQVCTHTTGHAETVLVEFDPTKVPYEQLLRVFWKIHDPTQVNRQGPDEGDSYRSVIFTFSPDEAAAATASEKVAQTQLSKPIATQIVPMTTFWKAEGYHQQYSERTGDHSCPISAQLESM